MVGEVSDDKKALQLVMKLPLKDNHGGIQRAVSHKFTNEDSMKKGSLKDVMDFLSEMLQQGKFVRLRNWMVRWPVGILSSETRLVC